MTRIRWPRYGAAAVGFAWYLYIGGGSTLHPLNIGWLLAGDWRQHWLGFLFFRLEPWRFPLGTVSSLLYPVGTNIGFTDSNPLLSILLKPFSGWLPAEFQLIGLWLAGCFAMQGYMGAALASTVTKNAWQQLLGGCLIALSPVLAGRIGHDTLCAQWIVIALLYLGLREYSDAAEAPRKAFVAAGLAIVSAAIHPYLAAMCWTLALAVFVGLWRGRRVTAGRLALLAVGTTVGMLAVFGAIGYLGGPASVSSGGFGDYSADLLTFVDPREFSRFFPDLRTRAGHWEGLGFLGAGGVVAAVVGFVTLIRKRPSLRPGMGVTIVACALMGVYALSWHVTRHDRQVVDLRPLYNHLEFITGPFRASGRFIWPLHYLVLLGGIWGLTRLPFSRAGSATTVLAIVVAVQAADYEPARWMLEEKHFREAAKDLAVAAGRYRHMALYPAQVMGVCGGSYEEDHVYRFMLAAYRLKMTFNSGIFARLPQERTREACDQSDHAVDAGKFDAQTLYVVPPEWAPRVKDLGAVCGRFDGDWVCVSRDSDRAFRGFLETGKFVDPR
jgi:hypothetical protein